MKRAREAVDDDSSLEDATRDGAASRARRPNASRTCERRRGARRGAVCRRRREIVTRNQSLIDAVAVSERDADRRARPSRPARARRRRARACIASSARSR